MRLVRTLLPGALLFLVVGLGVYAALQAGAPTSWLPRRHPGAVRGLALLFLLCDVAVAAALVTVLLTRDRWRAGDGPTWLPLRGRWLSYALLVLVIAAYAALAPGFLLLLIRMRPPGP